MTIDQFCAMLRTAGILGVDFYEKKLRNNEKNPAKLEDLACEGQVALPFAQKGWTVTMRESPDLEARWNGIYLGIEVKHFRYKASHDPLEDALLAAGDGEFVRVPLLTETEGREESWEQMFRFAVKNAHQYADGEYNVIFFWSSTQAHCDGTLLTAAHMYDEELEKRSCDPVLKNLSAMMMKSIWGDRGGAIFLELLPNARKPITPELFEMLDAIREPYDPRRI